jgi:hypothetical protein
VHELAVDAFCWRQNKEISGSTSVLVWIALDVLGDCVRSTDLVGQSNEADFTNALQKRIMTR